MRVPFTGSMKGYNDLICITVDTNDTNPTIVFLASFFTFVAHGTRSEPKR